MASVTHDVKLPRGLLLGIGGFVMATVLAVALYRVAGLEPTARPGVDDAPRVSHLITVELLPEGGAAIRDPVTGARIHALADGEDGFLRGLIRVVTRVRGQYRLPAEGPLRVTAWQGGRISLEDPATGWSADLSGFGTDNFQSFADLLHVMETAR